MATRAAWLLPRTGSDGQTREDTRLALSGGMTPAAATTARSGVMAGGTPFDLVGGGAMTFTIGGGRAYIQGTSAQGAYPVVSTSTTAFTAVDGHATNPRIDLYVLRVYDNFIDSSGSTVAQIERVGGTAASVPVAPSVPAGAIPLWELRVPAGASAGGGGIQGSPGWSTARTDRRYYTAAAGGIVPSGGPAWSGVYDGQYRDSPTTGRPERWSTGSSTWVDILSGAAWGRVGYAYQGTGTGPITDTTLLDDLTFTATVSTARRYSVQLVVAWYASASSVAADFTINYVAGTGPINSSGSGTTEITAVLSDPFAADRMINTTAYAEINGPRNGAITVGAFVLDTTDTGTIRLPPSSGHSLAMHDIGPAI
ncbi:hypothetical protein ACFRCG_41900 [Embleya sp. NPDC056575]|uniref:hypothetical protein n=1 Tax=unclassified Embleya TaxID=2699296 RepID=UPI0036993F20